MASLATHIGYKLFRVPLVDIDEDGFKKGTLTSLFSDYMHRIKYAPGEITTPPRGWGPLAMFGSLQEALDYRNIAYPSLIQENGVDKWLYKDTTWGRTFDIRVYEVEYIEAPSCVDNKDCRWFWTDTDRADLDFMPDGTVFASHVKPLKAVA